MLSPGAVLCFNWTFEDSSETGSRISQRLVSATESAALIAQASVLERSVPQGMEKLIAAIEELTGNVSSEANLRAASS